MLWRRGQALALYPARRRSGRRLWEIAEALGIGDDKTVPPAIRRFQNTPFSPSIR